MGLGVATGLLVASVQQQRQARKNQKRAEAVARRRRSLELRETQLENIRAFRRSVASATNTAIQTGGGADSSVLQGVQSSLLTQLGSNLTFNQQLEEFTRRQEAFLDKARSFSDNASVLQSFASLAASFSNSPAPTGGG